ncbi:MAG: hypothetical protein QOK21_3040 [Solirubrobacteraceae bacterium]|jgi:hypothetical protein|nr:hypothetical protein [Solirubrobacteraceae bacterium]
MADVALSATDVGNVLTYVAPGFFSYGAYRARLQQSRPEATHLLVVSVAASLPLVALGNQLAEAFGVARRPTQWQYVACLLVVAVAAGYVAASARSLRITRQSMRRLGLMWAPEASVYARTLAPLKGANVVVLFKDNRRLNGSVLVWPSSPDDGTNELYLTRPAWWSAKRKTWVTDGAGEGVIVNLDEVVTISLSQDPLASDRPAEPASSSTPNEAAHPSGRESADASPS